jgi:hypothetical protein
MASVYSYDVFNLLPESVRGSVISPMKMALGAIFIPDAADYK